MRRLLVIGAALGVLVAPGAASAATKPCDTKLQTFVFAYPVEHYGPQDLQVSKSAGLCYVNLDLEWHDVVALNATRPSDSAPWCVNFPPDPDDPTRETCPLFWTPLIAPGGNDPLGLANRQHDVEVQGLEDAQVGQTYTYFCSIHPFMTGTITITQ
jgi:plastocyanin